MSLGEILLLAVGGLAGGAINSIAGGGSLVVFPALLAVGLPPLPANVTNSVSQLPSYVGGVIGFRTELGGERRRIAWLIGAAALGSAVGCVLLLSLPAAAFDIVVPILVLLACLLLALQPRIRRSAGLRMPGATNTSETGLPRRPSVRVLIAVFAATIYGGYFGGALGVVLIGVLALVLPDSLRRINALKTVISLSVGTITTIVFALFGPVRWLAVAIVAPAALIGGLVGARIALRVRDDVLRWIVIVLGVGVASYLGYRAVRG